MNFVLTWQVLFTFTVIFVQFKIFLVNLLSELCVTLRFGPDMSFNSHTAMAGAIIGLLLVFLFGRQDFCYDHMTTQSL